MSNTNTQNDQESIELYQHVDAIKKTEAFRAVQDAAAELAHWEHVLLKAKGHIRELTRYDRHARRRLRALLRDSVEIRSFAMTDETMPTGNFFKRTALALGVVAAIVIAGAAVKWGIQAKPQPISPAYAATVEHEPAAVAAPAVPEEPQSLSQPPEAGLTVAEAADAFRAYAAANAPHLASCADALASHPRWVEALAISKQETGYCVKGVGRDNNCGGIKSHRPDREFKVYPTKCDGLEDIAVLIEKPAYAGLTIDEMNGKYCVDELRAGNRCGDWNANIMATVNDIRSSITQ